MVLWVIVVVNLFKYLIGLDNLPPKKKKKKKKKNKIYLII